MIRVRALAGSTEEEWLAALRSAPDPVVFDLPFKRGLAASDASEAQDFLEIAYVAEELARRAGGSKRFLGDETAELAGVGIELEALDPVAAADFLAKIAVGFVGASVTRAADVDDIDDAEQDFAIEVDAFAEEALAGARLEFPQLADAWLEGVLVSRLDEAPDEETARIHRERPEHALGFFRSLISGRTGFDVYKAFGPTYAVARPGEARAILPYTPFADSRLIMATPGLGAKPRRFQVGKRSRAYPAARVAAAQRLLGVLRPGSSTSPTGLWADTEGRVLLLAAEAGEILTFPAG